jgi:hypothetical protein
MKLYTEEQMRKCYQGVLQNVETCVKQKDLPKVDEYINSLTPVKLPNDDEIDNFSVEASNVKKHSQGSHIAYKSIISGAKWVIEKIKQQINE